MVNNNNISNTLNGATFTIDMVEWDENISDVVPCKPQGEEGGITGYLGAITVTTAATGTTVVNGLLYDRIYRITETVAPNGYKRAKPYFFLISSDKARNGHIKNQTG